MVIVSGSDRVDCEGFLTFPGRRAKRYSSKSLVACVILIFVLVVRHPIEGLAGDANQLVNLQVSESPQQGLACQQASEPQ